ncbi:MAG: HAD family hydrolase [Phycisphaerales bacterium]|nr:HAD family hydrolase [Phycisphaerales bacterium]
MRHDAVKIATRGSDRMRRAGGAEPIELLTTDINFTIADMGPAALDVVNRHREHLGLPPATLADILARAGSSRRLAGDLIRPTTDPEGVMREVLAVWTGAPLLYEGVTETLGYLRTNGVVTAAISNSPLWFAETVISAAGLSAYFPPTLIVSGAGKPSPTALRCLLQRLEIAPHRACHVGDDDADVACALGAGVRPVRACLDSHARIVASAPDVITISQFKELQDLVRGAHAFV